MNKLRAFFVAVLLFYRPLPSMASLPSMPQPEGFTGIVLPYAAGVKINGPYLGDADYDLSGSRGGKVSTSDEGRTLTGRVLNQSSGLDFQGSRFSVVTFMADGMLEYRSRDDLVFRPYLSTGLSYATINMDALGRAADDAAMMLQFGAGVGIELSPVVTFDARYRYLHPFDRRMRVEGVPVGMDIGTHNLLFGMKISF